MSAQPIVAKAEMLIRKPVAIVFEAFIDPAITAKFWFSSGTARLAPGGSVRWEWAMYGFSVDARVKAFEPDRRLVVEWSAYGPMSDIEWIFNARRDDTTYVSVKNSGFTGSADDIARLAVGATEGFAFVLAGAKALLEHNVRLNLVPDRFPDGLPRG